MNAVLSDHVAIIKCLRGYQGEQQRLNKLTQVDKGRAVPDYTDVDQHFVQNTTVELALGRQREGRAQRGLRIFIARLAILNSDVRRKCLN